MRILVFLAGPYVAFVLHECGHLLAGALMGYRFRFLAVGPIWIVRSFEGIKLHPHWSPRYWAPMAAASPPKADHFAARFAVYVAGGPVMSALVAIAAYALSAVVPVEWRLFARVVALASACVFVATAQPFGTGIGVPSDGARLLLYVTDRERATDVAAAATVDGLQAEGVAIDPELLARAAKVPPMPISDALRQLLGP